MSKLKIFMLGLGVAITHLPIYARKGEDGPSFSCKKASRIVEKTICQNKILSDFDRELAFLYNKVFKMSGYSYDLKKEQLNWLKRRPTHANELEVFYKERIQKFLNVILLSPQLTNEYTEDVSRYYSPDAYPVFARLFDDKDILDTALTRILDNNLQGSYLTYATKALLVRQNIENSKAFYNQESILYSKFLKISKNKGFIFYSNLKESKITRYSIFELKRTNGSFVIKPLILPYPEGYNATNRNSNSIENIYVDDEKKRIRRYKDDGTEHEFVWQFSENNVVLLDDGPSFDCKKASSIVEKTICQNDILTAHDQELAVVYKKALLLSKHPSDLKQEHLNWLKQRPTTEYELQLFYKERLQKLFKDIFLSPDLTNDDLKDIDYYKNSYNYVKNEENFYYYPMKEFLKEKGVLDTVLTRIFDNNLDSYYLSYATIALKGRQEGVDLEGPGNAEMRTSKFLKISKNKGIILFGGTAGARSQIYFIYELKRSNGSFSIKELALPYPNVQCSAMSSNVSLDHKKKRLSLSETSYDGNRRYLEWQFSEDYVVLLNHKSVSRL